MKVKTVYLIGNAHFDGIIIKVPLVSQLENPLHVSLFSPTRTSYR